MAESYQTVIIQSTAGQIAASFAPVIFKQYSDTVNTNFNSTVVFARTNPIYHYSDNSREINCSFVCPMNTNTGLTEIDKLGRMMYPSIVGTVYKDAPLVRAKFGNFTESPILGFFRNVKYEYVSPDTIGNFPLQFSPVAIPRFIRLDLQLTVIAQNPISANGSARVYAPASR